MSRKIYAYLSSVVLAFGTLVGFLSSSEAFVPAPQITTIPRMTLSGQSMIPSLLNSDIPSLDSTDSVSSTVATALSSSSVDLSAATLDPTTILSDVFGLFIGTPIILLVPILAALSVAAVLAWGIVSYANPEVEDDEM